MKCNVITPPAFDKRKMTKAVTLDFPVVYPGESVVRDFLDETVCQPQVIMDVFESHKALVVMAEIPGIDQKEIEIILDKDLLTLKGKKNADKEISEGDYHLLERHFGYFHRSIRLDFAPNPHDIEMTYQQGVLALTFKKPVNECVYTKGYCNV